MVKRNLWISQLLYTYHTLSQLRNQEKRPSANPNLNSCTSRSLLRSSLAQGPQQAAFCNRENYPHGLLRANKWNCYLVVIKEVHQEPLSPWAGDGGNDFFCAILCVACSPVTQNEWKHFHDCAVCFWNKHSRGLDDTLISLSASLINRQWCGNRAYSTGCLISRDAR